MSEINSCLLKIRFLVLTPFGSVPKMTDLTVLLTGSAPVIFHYKLHLYIKCCCQRHRFDQHIQTVPIAVSCIKNKFMVVL